MMRSKYIVPAVLASLLLFAFNGSAFAQGKSDVAKTRNFGIGHPKTAQDLPYGQLRKQIEGLPPKARGKALGWLQSFSFPAEDLKALRVNDKGEVSYADMILPLEADSPDSGGTVLDAGGIDSNRAFQLHSRPGSANVVYLDFDGETISNTAWSSKTLVALPFDPSGNDPSPTNASFTQTELDAIHEIWHRVSEDFAGFDIDVTTERPAVFTRTTGHLLFTHDVDANGVSMPSSGAGGVAYVNVFGSSNYAYYSPALVYYQNLFAKPNYIAEAGSHEFGHNLGLSHDGVVGGTTYYRGHGSGLVDWSPIMGNSYQRNVTQWSKGEYANANNSQDDLAIIAGDLGYSGDDHGESPNTATALYVESNGDILVSSPELDPDNVLPYNKGVIDSASDVDWFYVDVSGAGTVSFSATPAWHSFTRSDYRGSNMDVELLLMDSNLEVIAFDESDTNTAATVAHSVQPGRYFVQIDGVGNYTNSDYSDYSSTGMYFIEGNVPVDGTATDTAPPQPATMGWQSAPAATGTSSMTMTAVTATDESDPVEYYFTCVAGEAGCVDSGWQQDNTYALNGLSPNTYYAFKVQARDALGNANQHSATMGATTDPEPDTIPPQPATMSWQSVPSATGTSSVTMASVVATDDSGPVEYYFSCVEGGTGCVDSGWQQDNVYSLSGLAPDTYYAFTVQARDALGNSNQPSAAMGATTDPEAVEPDLDTEPPQPATMGWLSAPAATGTSSMTMSSAVAADESGPVEYYFTCVEGGAGCVDSGWQRSNVYSLNGLAPDTYYAFRVQARDALGNANQPSATMGASTDPEAVTPPQAANEDPVAVITYSPDPAVITKGKNVEVVLNGAGSYDPDGSIVSWTWKSSSGEVLGSGETYKVRLKEGTHSFTLEVVDNMGASAISSASVLVGNGTSDDGGGDEPKPKKPPPGKNKG